MEKKDRKIILKYKPFLSEIVVLDQIKSLVKEYKIFTKLMFDDVFGPNGEKDFYDELCTRGPKAFSHFIEILEKAEYFDFAQTLQKESDNSPYPTSYKMDSDPLGYCLIIINKDFGDLYDTRDGCEVDAEALENLFKNVLNFEVKVEWNKKGAEIKKILEKFSKKPEFKDVDCCVVYILSHGGEHGNLDFVYGTDGEKVYKRDIYTFFNNENCELLIDKPKILFFQACRGKLLDKEKTGKSCENDDNACSNVKKPNSHDSVDCPSPQIDKNVASELSYPILSDMFIVHSTLLYYKSWKDKFTGSWLCQDLVTVIKEYYNKCHLSEMMTIVSDKQKKRRSVDGYKQITHCDEPGICSLIYFNKTIKKNKES